MGTLKYPGAPDFTYPDDALSTLQQIIAIQSQKGQGFWLQRRGKDETVIGHDAIWIHPDHHIYIEFDSLDVPDVDEGLLNQWKQILEVKGADKLVLSPGPDTLLIIKEYLEKED